MRKLASAVTAQGRFKEEDTASFCTRDTYTETVLLAGCYAN